MVPFRHPLSLPHHLQPQLIHLITVSSETEPWNRLQHHNFRIRQLSMPSFGHEARYLTSIGVRCFTAKRIGQLFVRCSRAQAPLTARGLCYWRDSFLGQRDTHVLWPAFMFPPVLEEYCVPYVMKRPDRIGEYCVPSRWGRAILSFSHSWIQTM